MKTTLNDLILIIQKLRGPKGCPWDQRQTLSSLVKYFNEESKETIEALQKNDFKNLCEELGDLLFLIILATEIANDKDEFNINDVIRSIKDKMIRRHPHVFAGLKTGNKKELDEQWKAIKAKEKSEFPDC